jgi:hypothetical protein
MMIYKTARCSILVLTLTLSGYAAANNADGLKVRGWNLLSIDVGKGESALDAAAAYNINHLQLSHQLIMDLNQVRDPRKLTATQKLIAKAQHVGMENILVWDHALYKLDYYPDQFKNEKGKINLDDPEFWVWFKNDYREMLDQLPGITGVVLTFIETGAHVEDQYSKHWKTEAEKLAHLVDEVASVVIDERGMQLFIRTVIYSKHELNTLLECVNTVQHPEVLVMTKEVPHDFFLTHPVSSFIEQFDKDVIIEFDLGHEYNGQGIIANVLPETTIERWKYYSTKENVVGYVARTDRFNNTQNVGRPTEINLYALNRISEDTSLTAKEIVEEYITEKYGEKLVPYLTDVFLETDDIITSVLYTLGLHVNYHSALDFEYQENYSRHCSGNWLENPEVTVGHNVNKTFNYWTDVIEHLSPARYKSKRYTTAKYPNGRPSILYREAPWIIDDGLVTPAEQMNMEYLRYIVQEKQFGLEKANWAVAKIKSAEPLFRSAADYQQLLSLYERTALTAELYLYASEAYFGFRCHINNGENEKLNAIIKNGLEGIQTTCAKMEAYPDKGPRGQFSWIKDVESANAMSEKIVNGWDEYDGHKVDL